MLGIAHARVEAIQQHDARHREPQTAEKAEQQHPRRGVFHRLQWHHRAVENANVRNAARLRQAGAFVVLLQVGVQVVGDRHGAAQARFLDRPGRNAPQRLGGRPDAAIELRLPRPQHVDQGADQCGDGLLLQRRHFRCLAGEGRIRLGVMIPQGAQLRLLGGQLLQRVLQLRRVLHGTDDLERGREARVGRLRQNPRQGLPIPRDLLALHLLLEEVPEDWIPRRLALHTHRIGRQGDRAAAEALQVAFRPPQVFCRRANLVADDARELGEPAALELRSHFHVALRHGVENRRDAHRIRAAQFDLEEVAVVVHVGVKRVVQIERGFTRGLQSELHGVVGRQRVRGRRPQESEAAPDGVAHRPAVQHAPAQLREHVAVHAVARETVVSGAELVSDVQGAEGGVGPLRHLQVQPLVAGHAIEDRV